MERHVSIDNDKGLGILKIVPFELGDYLKTEKPNVVSWYDCHGSVGKYVSLLDEPNNVKTQITSVLRGALNSGIELDLSSIIKELKSFCTVFSAGKVHINTYKEADYSSNEPNSEYRRYRKWSIACPRRIEKANEEKERERYTEYFNEKINEIGWIPGSIVDFTTSGFYDAFESHFIFTQTKESLNQNVIKEYQKLILEGKRPYCIIYNSEISDNDNNYVIDGHHKLMAYHNLKIRPYILEFTQISEVQETKFNVDRLDDDLFGLLYTWQLKHIFDNGISPNSALNNVIESNENRFNQFVKNGLVEEKWVNGNTKLKGYYKNDKPDGKLEYFFENGNKKSVVIYKDGKQLRYIKSWFVSGELQSECVPNDDILNGEQISYHKSGEISGKTIFKDGKVADGKSAFTYAQDGRVTYEAEYENGENIRSRWFDRNGNVTEQRGKY